jgi:hypothetical protein
MKYSYELKYEIGLTKKQKMFFVYESENGIKSRILVENILFAKNHKEFKNSQLERMYMWLKENHPELLL